MCAIACETGQQSWINVAVNLELFSQRLQEYWSSRLKWDLLCQLILLKRTSLYKSVTHYLYLYLYTHIFHQQWPTYWEGLHSIQICRFRGHRPTSTHIQLKRKKSTFWDPKSKLKCLSFLLKTILILMIIITDDTLPESLCSNIWYWDCLGFCLLIFANINTCKRQPGQPPCDHPYEATCKLWSLHQSETNWDSLGKLTLWMW